MPTKECLLIKIRIQNIFIIVISHVSVADPNCLSTFTFYLRLGVRFLQRALLITILLYSSTEMLQF